MTSSLFSPYIQYMYEPRDQKPTYKLCELSMTVKLYLIYIIIYICN